MLSLREALHLSKDGADILRTDTLYIGRFNDPLPNVIVRPFDILSESSSVLGCQMSGTLAILFAHRFRKRARNPKERRNSGFGRADAVLHIGRQHSIFWWKFSLPPTANQPTS